MKTKVFVPGAICAAIALLVVFSLPAYAKSGGSSSAHTRVSKTPSNTASVKSVTSSRKTQSSSGTASNAASSKATQSGTVQSDRTKVNTTNYTYPNFGGSSDAAQMSTIVMMQATKGAREDLKGVMDGVKKSNTQKSYERDRKYKPY